MAKAWCRSPALVRFTGQWGTCLAVAAGQNRDGADHPHHARAGVANLMRLARRGINNIAGRYARFPAFAVDYRRFAFEEEEFVLLDMSV